MTKSGFSRTRSPEARCSLSGNTNEPRRFGKIGDMPKRMQSM